MRIFLLSIFSLYLLYPFELVEASYLEDILSKENQLLEYKRHYENIPIIYQKSVAYVIVGTSIKWKIVDSDKFYRACKHIEAAESRIDDIVAGSIFSILLNHTYKYNENNKYIVSDSDIIKYEKEILKISQNILKEIQLGIEFIEIQISSIHSSKIEKDIAMHEYNAKKIEQEYQLMIIEQKRLIEEAEKLLKLTSPA